LANPGRLFNEVGYLPESIRLKLDRACIDSAVRTGRNLPNDALLFINILGSTLIQLNRVFSSDEIDLVQDLRETTEMASQQST
jgi:hypothetical protein